MLDVLHVSKKINDKIVIDDCSFQTKNNSIFGIVGINGVGKTTLLRLCSGILKPDEGTILLGTETIYSNIEAKKNIVYIPDSPYYEPNSTVISVKRLYEAFYDIDNNYFEYLLDRFELKKNDFLIHLSKGMLKRFYLVIALAIAPKLLLLDETFDGIDPKCKRIFKEEIKKIVNKKKINVVLTSHSLRELSNLADEIAYLVDGKLLKIDDKTYLNDPIYRVVVYKKPNVKYDINKLYVLKMEELESVILLDVYNKPEDIKYVFSDVLHLEIKEVSFDNWVVYQMEVLK